MIWESCFPSIFAQPSHEDMVLDEQTLSGDSKDAQSVSFAGW
jgi:hypothetical protein